MEKRARDVNDVYHDGELGRVKIGYIKKGA